VQLALQERQALQVTQVDQVRQALPEPRDCQELVTATEYEVSWASIAKMVIDLTFSVTHDQLHRRHSNVK